MATINGASFAFSFATILTIVTIITTLSTSDATTGEQLISYDTRNRFECPSMPTTCSCSLVITDIEIQCPIADPNIIVRIQPGTYAQIECGKASEHDYSLLPAMNVGTIQTIQIRRCPLPLGQSLDAITKRIGARGIRTLRFQSYGADLGGNIVRKHFQGLQNLERLILSSNSLSDLPADLFSDLRNLTWLDLSSNRLHLRPDIFVNLEKLEFLELGYNNLQQLEPGIFRSQKRLKHLNLWSNNLQNLTKESFEGISSILDLDLSTNKLTTLEPDVFTHLTNLRNINLGGNNFTELPERLFENNRDLKLIRLLENRTPMVTLPSGFLSNLPALEDVRIKAYLSQVPGNLFAGSENIRNISLAGNRLVTLPGDLFAANRSSLLDLDLSRNKLTELPDEIFSDTHSLLVLNLAYNKLVNITRQLFINLPNLEEVHLQNNRFLYIEPEAFQTPTDLRIIELQNNQLNFKDFTAVQLVSEGAVIRSGSPFQKLENLETLNLRNNSVGYIFNDWIFNLKQLKQFDLSYNNITMFSANDLSFTSSNIELNLSHNAIEEIEFRNIQHMLATKNRRAVVDLGDNPLTCNCIMIEFLQFLKGDLAQHMTENVQILADRLQCDGPKTLAGRSVMSLHPKELVCNLDSSNSEVKRCPDKCTCMVRLYDRTLVVNCSNAGLKEIPQLPPSPEFGMPYIELYIEHNQIQSLPRYDYPGYAHISEIHARFNNISELTVENLPANLSLLDLSNNSLSWLNESVFNSINITSRMRSLTLGNNPWRCDCSTLNLLTFVRTNFKRIQDLDMMRCITGEKLSSLASSDICPEDQILIIIACILAALGLLFGILASLYYRYQSEVKVWLYAHNMCLWFVTEEELDKDKKYDAFISYSHKDQDFISDVLQPALEKGPDTYKLCLHERDWPIGDYIPNQIIRSVDDSRRTIIVLSPNYLESVWGRMEFQAAHKAALEEGRARVVVIIYGDIGNTDNLDPELRAYINMNTYLKWGDPWFWKKLRYALPHRQLANSKSSKGLKKNVKHSIDDKLELIKPIPTTPPPLTTPPAEQATKNILLTPDANGKIANGGIPNGNLRNGLNGHVNGAFIINTNAKQSDV